MNRLIVLLLILPGISLLRANEWEKLENCTLAAGAYFDGDSFRIHHQGREMVVRLYFVDCPEIDRSYPARLAEQSGHFGGSIDKTLTLGREAKAETASLLSVPFTVLTRREDARGSKDLPRYFGFVTTSDGQDLGEVLVKNGLAWVRGPGAAPPGGNLEEIAANYARWEQGALPPPEKASAAPAVDPSGTLKNSGKRWTPEQDQELRDSLGKREGIETIAERLGRTPKAVTFRMQKLGLTEPAN